MGDVGASAAPTGPLAEGGAAKASPAKPSVPSAANALRLLGGHATALDVKDKITCPHCGFGLSDSAAERLIHHDIDAGDIVIQRDWSLRLASAIEARSGETGTGSTEGESAARKETPKDPQESNQ